MTTSPVKIWRTQKEKNTYIGRVGTLLLWTIIHVPAKGMGSQVPYPVAIIELGEKERFICQMVDYEESDLVKNRKVILVLRRGEIENTTDVINYVVKCKPL